MTQAIQHHINPLNIVNTSIAEKVQDKVINTTAQVAKEVGLDALKYGIGMNEKPPCFQDAAIKIAQAAAVTAATEVANLALHLATEAAKEIVLNLTKNTFTKISNPSGKFLTDKKIYRLF